MQLGDDAISKYLPFSASLFAQACNLKIRLAAARTAAEISSSSRRPGSHDFSCCAHSQIRFLQIGLFSPFQPFLQFVPVTSQKYLNSREINLCTVPANLLPGNIFARSTSHILPHIPDEKLIFCYTNKSLLYIPSQKIIREFELIIY